MNLIVGLGNPGEKYKHNRHNVGYLFVEHLLLDVFALKDPGSWKKDKYLLSEIAKPTDDVILAKPQTYMNASGEAVRKLLEKMDLGVEDLIVVHDDLDIPLGKFRIVTGYGPKLHNGLESIQNHLHSMDFLRVRIGVDNRTPEARIPGIDYVLQDFLETERPVIASTFPQIVALLKQEKRLPAP